MNYPIEQVGDIPIKLKETQTFGLSLPATREPLIPNPICPKVSEVNIDDLLTKEVHINDLSPIQALALLNYFITHLLDENNGLVAHSEFSSDDGDSDGEFAEQDTPLSPKKNTKYHDNRSDTFQQKDSLVKGFSLRSPPSLTPTQFLERFNKYCEFSTAVYLSAAHYIYKLTIEQKLINLGQLNTHRLLIAALRVSCKILEDVNHSQKFVAKIAGVHLKDLRFLEISFLFLVKFDCYIDSSHFERFIQNLREIYLGNV